LAIARSNATIAEKLAKIEQLLTAAEKATADNTDLDAAIKQIVGQPTEAWAASVTGRVSSHGAQALAESIKR
jgi:hypothetical protein